MDIGLEVVRLVSWNKITQEVKVMEKMKEYNNKELSYRNYYFHSVKELENIMKNIRSSLNIKKI